MLKPFTIFCAVLTLGSLWAESRGTVFFADEEAVSVPADARSVAGYRNFHFNSFRFRGGK